MGERCNICGSENLRKLKFHDMGDIRPILREERNILLGKIPFKEVRDYLKNRLILVARQPGLDYRRDIFVDGFRLGTLEYIKDGRWRYRFIPSGKGASLFYTLSGIIDFEVEMKGHIKGKKLPRKISSDWEIFSTGNCIGVAVPSREGSKIKDVFCRRVKPKKKSILEDAVHANMAHLANMEKNAMQLIKRKKAKFVAFSGGKDSEVALYLAHLAGVNKAIYANTGLEFPETERFVYNFADFLGIELIEVKPKSDFWKMADNLGIPTKDNRWCTHALKLDSLKRFSGVIVDGTRRYESMARFTKGSEYRMGNLRVIYPIIDWLALDVWLYIHMKNLPYNPLYDMGYERIGCYMCPAMLNAEFHRVRKTHPHLYRRWYRYLLKHGFTRDEIIDGIWRWKNLPRKIKELDTG